MSKYVTYSVALRTEETPSKRVSLGKNGTRVVWHRKGLTGHLTAEQIDELVHPWAKEKYGDGAYTLRIRTIRNPGAEILATAMAQVGVKESPPGSNRGPKVTKWMHRVGYDQPGPWCAGFACCMCEDAGYPLLGGGSASCRVLRERAQKAGRWRRTSNPERGWLGIVLGDKHVVIVDRVDADGMVHQISGNTSATNGQNFNGGMVATHTTHVSAFSGFIDTTTPRKKKRTP